MKKNRNFNLVLIGLIISLFGSAIQRFSFSLYLLDLTQDAAIFSNVMAISVLPFILFAPLSGSIADRCNKKYIMVVLDICSFLTISGYLILNGNTGALSQNRAVLLTAIVMFLLSAISAFYTPAVTAIIPFIVDKQELIKANAYVSQVGSVSNLAGPILAGLLYGIWGIRGITILNAVSFLGSAVMELCIVYHPVRQEKAKESVAGRISMQSSIREMVGSYRYLRSEKRIVLQFIESYCMNNIGLVPVMTILMPYVLRNQLHVTASAYGIVEGIIAAGMIVGAFLVGAFPQRFAVNRVYLWNILMAGAVLLMSGAYITQPGMPLILSGMWTVCGFFIMLALGVGNVVTLSYTQTIIESSHLGRVSAFSTAVATISVPVGQLLFGWYLKMNLSIALLLIIVTVLNVAVGGFLKRAVRMNHYR